MNNSRNNLRPQVLSRCSDHLEGLSKTLIEDAVVAVAKYSSVQKTPHIVKKRRNFSLTDRFGQHVNISANFVNNNTLFFTQKRMQKQRWILEKWPSMKKKIPSDECRSCTHQTVWHFKTDIIVIRLSCNSNSKSLLALRSPTFLLPSGASKKVNFGGINRMSCMPSYCEPTRIPHWASFSAWSVNFGWGIALSS